MSGYFSKRNAELVPYTPGEQPSDMKYIKLNTNESPFPPSPKALKYAEENTRTLQLYSDPENRLLTEKIAEKYGVSSKQVLVTNGSDEILNFAVMAFCDDSCPAVFPDISYGFYEVFAQINHVPSRKIPLRDDFSVAPEDYFSAEGTVILANPNAPTGMALETDEIRKILNNNPNNVVVIDEAYVDFGGESCVPLISEYPNLLVTQTFSKSRSLAGARIGFGIGSEELIQDLNTIKYSTNPYNVNSYSSAVGIGALEDEEYMRKNCQIIQVNRRFTEEALRTRNFRVLPSKSNFLFAKTNRMSGGELYRRLKARGILVRHFEKERIADYVRITIGTMEQMEAFLNVIDAIMEDMG